ncbi:sulfite exporter TauE/SafE family protein [Pigmentibacter ruber]|uniref:sulfite exporter TauE/SafE family protein n=1 Tax=Pigmentibacter ruber TaxID=2683196 RepID=UPI00131E4B5C|nr:sulfite exporter TauE/SafE family protein [Pigmentibacter ruber]BFD32316.1 sulfite exporter TauE/SafE family protein [Pigmentibacter ruber]
MLDLLYFLLLGAFAGTIAGLLGLGGGIILVPSLIWIFQYKLQIQQDKIMHMTIATSMTTIVFTALFSIYAHQKRKAIHWPAFKKLLPGMVIGTLIGVFIANSLSSSILKITFAFFLLIVAVQIEFLGNPKGEKKFPGYLLSNLFGYLIGNFSALVGIGGGSLIVPLLLWFRIPIRNAIATSAACGLPIALSGAIGFVILGFKSSTYQATGYIYWPAVFAIVPASLIFVPLGVKLAHRLPIEILKKIFAIFLVIISIKMLLSEFL